MAKVHSSLDLAGEYKHNPSIMVLFLKGNREKIIKDIFFND